MTTPRSRLLDPPRAAWLAAIALMGVLGAAWLSYQTFRYFAVPTAMGERQVTEGAIDLHDRYREVHSWFAGEPVYRLYGSAVYAPASYAILAIVLYPLSWTVAKVLWFVASLASMVWLSRQLVRRSLARSCLERWFIAIMPFGFYATGAALGNGQLVLFVLPLVLGALLVFDEGHSPRPARNLWLGSLLMLAALVQPTIAAPFFWIVLFRASGLKPASLIAAGYLALTAFAAWFQMQAYPRLIGDSNPLGVAEIWSRRAQGGTHHGSVHGGYGTVHNLLAEFGLKEWSAAVSIAILLLVGAWIFRHRRGDLWILLGVTAIVARVWTYHRWYDDLLLILPLLSLFRLSRSTRMVATSRAIAAVLFVWIWLFLLPPGVLYTLPSPGLAVVVQVSGWLAALAFLVAVAEAGAGEGSQPTADPRGTSEVSR